MLYSATSILKSRVYGDLTIYWFVFHRPVELPLAGLVADPTDILQKQSVEELFTQEEVQHLRDYLKKVHGDELEIYEENLPDPELDYPMTFYGCGEGFREINLEVESTYDLPFVIHGSYYLFENIDEQEDPDYTFEVDGGLVSTAGGEPVGMIDEGDVPDKLIEDHLNRIEGVNE